MSEQEFFILLMYEIVVEQFENTSKKIYKPSEIQCAGL